MFDTVLVANRGEIAVRVIRTLRRLGVRSVAVYSDADTDARHVREADTAVRIGPATAAHSYLSAERLLEAARATGAQAVHPGYGFLAENADFARACAAADLVFVGPPPEAIALMGDKIRAKETVTRAGVPVVPGCSGRGMDDAALAEAAREVGLPVLLKPSAGGGGKGMRRVRDETRLAEEIAAARREARGAFGDDTLLVERWIDRPRHIEVQVMADAHGTVVHLGERECSLQRRHQKIVEEAPSPLLDETLRAAMGEAAVRVARSCGYRGAGTVEFIVSGAPDQDAATPPYFFLEMNTRLQVEHPVTELVTGWDLVELQLRVAAGEPLPFDQADVTLTGHAVEARLYAEAARPDPTGERVDFLPSSGTVRLLREPAGEGVRVDSSLTEGTVVGTDYDPMLAKVVAHGTDRATALRRLDRALADTTVLGLETNTAFLRRLLTHPAVAAGELDTGLVDREAAGLVGGEPPAEAYALAALVRHAARWRAAGVGGDGWVDPFAVPSGFRLGGEPAWTTYPLRAPGGRPVEVAVRGTPDRAQVRVGEAEPVTAALAVDGPPDAAGRPHLTWQGVTRPWWYAPDGDGCWLGRDGESWRLVDHDPVAAALRGAVGAHGADTLTAPMPGTVTVVKVAVGDEVTAGQSLVVMEAMKMEQVITAPHDGTVVELTVSPGDTVALDQVLAAVEPRTPEDPTDAPAPATAGAPGDGAAADAAPSGVPTSRKEADA